jgi:lipopolysaccharide/colanic/teichoic acid biosynthesis glycosyltransferase
LSGIVVDLRADLGPRWEQFLARAALAGVPIYHWKQIAESLTGTVEVEHLSENTFGALLPSSVYLRFKRVIDFMAAIVLSPIAILIAGGAALAIRLGDDGPVLFRQTRIGLGGRPFTMLKFRTMRCDAKSGPAFTEADDPRITPVGKVLRRYRIDELPQIINILRGEMSWIGPRPEAVDLAAWYEDEIPYYSYRHTVRPGITGWAQVNQGNVAEIAAASDKLKFDFYYIKYFSPWLDALIAAKTLHTIVSGYGAR